MNSSLPRVDQTRHPTVDDGPTSSQEDVQSPWATAARDATISEFADERPNDALLDSTASASVTEGLNVLIDELQLVLADAVEHQLTTPKPPDPEPVGGSRWREKLERLASRSMDGASQQEVSLGHAKIGSTWSRVVVLWVA